VTDMIDVVDPEAGTNPDEDSTLAAKGLSTAELAAELAHGQGPDGIPRELVNDTSSPPRAQPEPALLEYWVAGFVPSANP